MERPPPRHVREPLLSFESGATRFTAPGSSATCGVPPEEEDAQPFESACTTTMHGSLRDKEDPMEGPEIQFAEATIDNGSYGTRTVRFETGRLAKQAGGAVVAYLDEDTMLLSTTTAGKYPKEQFDFFPLTVDVEERMYAAGKIPGSFFRLEGRPSTGATRVSLIDGSWIAFPTFADSERSVFDMVVAGRVVTDKHGVEDVAIMMVEAESTMSTWDLVKVQGQGAPTESVVAEGLEASKKFIAVLCQAQTELAAKAAKPVQDFPVFLDYQDDVHVAVEGAVSGDLTSALQIADKQDRESRIDEVKAAVQGDLAEKFEGREKEISAAYRAVQKKLIRQRILRDKIRIDGRGLADIRALGAEVEVLPRVHGSAIFERGETQIMGVTTLNMLRMEQMLDTLSPETRKRYMHN